MYQIVMIGGIFAIMYFMMIRPQKKRQQELSLMRENLAVGDKVVTIGAIVGKVTKVKDDEFHLLSADKTTLVFKKSAIALVEPKSNPAQATVEPVEVEAEAVTERPDGVINDQETEIKE